VQIECPYSASLTGWEGFIGNTGKRCTEAQIIAILKEAEADGAKVGDVLRRHVVPAKTYYRWKAKLGGVELSDARRLKELDEENRRLKRIVADQSLNLQVLRDLLGKR
jgi:putative transposase